MSDTIYPQGVKAFSPKDGSPEWVAGDLIISLDEFKEFVNSNQDLLSEYKGKKQLRLSLLNGRKGLYLTVNTFKPKENAGEQQAEDDGKNEGLPF